MACKCDCVTTDIFSSPIPLLFSFLPSPPLFLPLMQMHPQQLVVSWFSLVLLASPIVAMWELEKNGNQPFLILFEGPRAWARTVRQSCWEIRLKWAVTGTSLWDNGGPLSLFHLWGYLYCMAWLFGSHIKCQRRSFWWTMVGKEIQTLPVLLKISCMLWLRFQSEGFEKYKNYVFPPTMQYQPLSWHWDDLPLTKHFGESTGF